MSEYIEGLIVKYRDRGLLVDANLLMLFFVGEFLPDQIGRLRRTKKFVRADYVRVKDLIGRFKVCVTTPNILTEVSNLSGDIPSGLRAEFFRLLQTGFTSLEEEYLPSKQVANAAAFFRFGLTDAVIAQIANQRYLVLTDDFPLSNFLHSIKADVINFNHLLSLSA